MSQQYLKAYYCEECCVVMVHHSERYCVDCANDITQYLYAAEQIEQDTIEEAEYIAAIEEKQLNFYFDER